MPRPSTRNLAIAALVVAGLGCAAWLAYGFMHRNDDMKVVRNHFVDAETLAFETHTTGDFPPLAGRHEHEIVYAKCFQGDDGLVIGWLERYPDEVKQQLDAARSAGTMGPGLMISSSLSMEVRRPEAGSPWVARSSDEGKAICTPPKLKDGSDATPAQP